jgi:hypothetical protein
LSHSITLQVFPNPSLVEVRYAFTAIKYLISTPLNQHLQV